MPFIDAASRKRARSNSRGVWPFSRTTKVPRLEAYDGPSSRQSFDAITTSSNQVDNLRAKLKRGSSHIKSLLGLNNRPPDAEVDDDDIPMILTDHGSPESFRSLQPSTATTIIKPLRLILTGAARGPGNGFVGDLPRSIKDQECPTEKSHVAGQSERKTESGESHSGGPQRHMSSPNLTHKASNRFEARFGQPTVVHRSRLHSRPSVHSVQPLDRGFQTDGAANASMPSRASQESGYGSPPSTTKQSTSPTSDDTALSPSSSTRRGTLTPFDVSKAITIFNREMEQHRLSPISEVTHLSTFPSILTVEATANAKIFFETHFNRIFNERQPRSVRRKELDDRLESLGLPSDICHRARKAWQQHETENLRHERVLKGRTYGSGPRRGVSVAGYEVVKVLGKGSFGVVRLVREAPVSGTKSKDLASLRPTTKPSRIDLTTFKASARDVFAPLSLRKRIRPKMNKEVYAMKVIRKSEMIRNSQEGHLRAERDFLVASEGCRWIIPLIASFQDRRHLYLVMDYCVGGDFLGLLIRHNTLSEDVTKWYIAEMILCVEEAHRMKWIHRDVKPDNFLIGADGHLKISDFGLAFDGEWAHDQQYFHKHRHALLEKLGIELDGDEQDQEDKLYESATSKGQPFTSPASRSAKKKPSSHDDIPAGGETILDWRNRERRRKLARSVVGTSQYMAPEVIRGELYDGRCDWWSIGIIMYECLYGYTPFACENRQDTKIRILHHKKTLTFPEEASKGRDGVGRHALDLMWRILQEKEKRLCSKRYQLNDFTRTLVNGRPEFVFADKTSQDYSGHFVYADDAEDIKGHKFFRRIPWKELHLIAPPFIPRVKSSEDTKYFDDDVSISDISELTDEESDWNSRDPALDACANGGLQDATMTDVGNAAGPRISQHQPEEQKIVPSAGMQPKKVAGLADDIEQNQAVIDAKMPNPLIVPALKQQVDGEFSHADDTVVDADAQQPSPQPLSSKKQKKKKEQKRPRDKILRDAGCGRKALEIRKQGAFLGYGYRKAKGVEDVIADVLGEMSNEPGWTVVEEKKVAKRRSKQLAADREKERQEESTDVSRPVLAQGLL